MCYELNREKGNLLRTEKDIYLPEGFGPRHLALHGAHPGYIYVIGELTGEIAVLEEEIDQYAAIQRISSLSDQFFLL